ncbi:MAG: hypothetical protein ACI39G_04770 [Pseudoramibacter sp.]
MKYEQLKNLKRELVKIGQSHNIKVCHFFNDNPKDNFILWGEDGTTRAFGDGVAGQKAVQGTVDYYTKTEYDPIVDEIDTAILNTAVTWLDDGPTIDYEPDTGYIHYQWIWEVI